MGQTAGYVAIIIAVGSIFFEVSKIKINPISFLLKWIGKRMFEPMNSRLDAVEKKIDENEIDRIRWEILEFANTCRNGKRHTKDEFSHIISQNDRRTTIFYKKGGRHGKEKSKSRSQGTGIFQGDYEAGNAAALDQHAGRTGVGVLLRTQQF